jgi:hypothetical protein
MKPDIKVAALGPRCGGGDENTYNGSRAQIVNFAGEWRRLEEKDERNLWNCVELETR